MEHRLTNHWSRSAVGMVGHVDCGQFSQENWAAREGACKFSASNSGSWHRLVKGIQIGHPQQPTPALSPTIFSSEKSFMGKLFYVKSHIVNSSNFSRPNDLHYSHSILVRTQKQLWTIYQEFKRLCPNKTVFIRASRVYLSSLNSGPRIRTSKESCQDVVYPPLTYRYLGFSLIL